MGRVAQSVQRLATGWKVWGSNPGGGEIFCTCPDQPWGPPSLLYSGYQVFPGGNERPGRDADPSPRSGAVVLPLWAVWPVQSLGACTRVHFTFTFGQERVELYLYSHYGPYGLYRASVPVQGSTLPFTLPLCNTGYLSLCVDDCLVCRVEFHPAYQSSTQSDKYQVSHRYSYFS